MSAKPCNISGNERAGLTAELARKKLLNVLCPLSSKESKALAH